jgi:hypothetical protein
MLGLSGILYITPKCFFQKKTESLEKEIQFENSEIKTI